MTNSMIKMPSSNAPQGFRSDLKEILINNQFTECSNELCGKINASTLSPTSKQGKSFNPERIENKKPIKGSSVL